MQTKPNFKYLESITWILKAPHIWNIEVEVAHSVSSIYAVNWIKQELCEKMLYDYVINSNAEVQREHW